MLSRYKILSKAKDAVKHRESDDGYGDPTSNFSQIAAYYTAHLATDISPFDVGAMFILAKLSRLQSNPLHEDSWVDIAGYAAVTYEAMLNISGIETPEEHQNNIVSVMFQSDFSDQSPEE